MGMNTILMLIAGIVMSTMVATQVAPSIVEGVKVKKTQVQTINNQEVIFEAIKRYTTIKQVAPTSIQDLIDAGYLEANVNNNGFSEEYTINVDKALGVATITTTIVDPKVQEAFLNSFMGTSKPTRVGTTNNFQTKYVLPNEVMHGNALLMTGIPIQGTPPDSNINKYWYDTSSGKATLKLYDGTNWVEVNLGGEANTQTFEPGNYDVTTIRSYSYSNSGYTNVSAMVFQYMMTRSGKVRVSFTINNNNASGGYARIYVNGVAKGIQRNITTTPTTYSEDIFVNKGDKLQIYGNFFIYSTSYISNVRIMTTLETMYPVISL
ncbi:hypothetical protein [Aliarcobacter cryaerophilus]|uniref:hypothetical protein n=1 Tax=Aliarcobacter cryaerophilus TaxID=28198 RepID=UPI0011E00EFC|nr:hypothetical protein [Aliarcobacter cryaerophilus]